MIGRPTYGEVGLRDSDRRAHGRSRRGIGGGLLDVLGAVGRDEGSANGGGQKQGAHCCDGKRKLKGGQRRSTRQSRRIEKGEGKDGSDGGEKWMDGEEKRRSEGWTGKGWVRKRIIYVARSKGAANVTDVNLAAAASLRRARRQLLFLFKLSETSVLGAV